MESGLHSLLASTGVQGLAATVCLLVTQSCPTLCHPMGCINLPGSSVHGSLQERILEWVAISFSPIIQTGNEG